MRRMILVVALFLPLLGLTQSVSSGNNLLEPELLKEDLELLYKQLRENHPRLFAYRNEQEAEKTFIGLMDSLRDPLDRMSFFRLVAPFVNDFRDGHTMLNVDFDDSDLNSYEAAGGRFFPLEVAILENRLYCTTNPYDAGKIAKGDEILRIGKHKVSDLLPVLNKLMPSDGEANARANTQRLFGFVLWLHGTGGRDFEVSYKRDGKTISEKLPGLSKEELLELTFSSITPPTKLDIYPESGLAVVRINSYGNVPTTKKFIDSAFTVIRDRQIKNVALDLRKNGGGSSAVGDYFLAHLTNKPYSDVKRKSWRFGPLMQELDSTHYIAKVRIKAKKEYRREGEMWHGPEWKAESPNVILTDSSLFEPRNLYLFTSPRTYSSAHMTAMAVKCGELGVIIGQPTGERLNLTGEPVAFKLPHTGFTLYIPTAVYETFCGDGNRVGVAPDHLVPFTVEDLRTGKDPELSFLLELLKKDL